MGFRFFGPQMSPIAIDFGSSSVKVLQTGLGDRPTLVAAAELLMPIEADDPPETENVDFLAEELPRVLRKGGFKGRRVVLTVPSQHTVIQHIQLSSTEGMKREDAIKSQLQMQMNIAPRNTVIRWIDVTDIHRDGQTKTELICFAIPRDVVMRYVSLLEKMRMQVLDVQTEVQSMVRAFDHIHRRAGDENITTMYIDLGWANTRVAIAHGKAVTFARSIQIGGRQFDRLIAQQLQCDFVTARAHRLALQSPVPSRAAERSKGAAGTTGQSPRPQPQAESAGDEGGGFARLAAAMAKEQAAESAVERERREDRSPAVLPHAVEADETTTDESAAIGHEKIDLTEVIDTITDELSMCLRYHRGLFPSRQIDRAILLGGEARQPWLCKHIVRALRIPARLGDPLARFIRDDRTMETIGLAENCAQPGWAAVSGLCATTD